MVPKRSSRDDLESVCWRIGHCEACPRAQVPNKLPTSSRSRRNIFEKLDRAKIEDLQCDTGKFAGQADLTTMPLEEPISTEPSKSSKDKSERKHKSKSKEDKKRKREHTEDGEKRKSKKHRKSNGDVRTEDIKSLQTDSSIVRSPFHTQTSSLYLPLSPISQRRPLEGVCAEHISPLILTYYPPFRGVVLSYSNPRLSSTPFSDDGPETLFQCIDEYGVSYAWVTADFLLFKPGRGGELEGYVNLQNEGHLGLVCWNLFNASIERQRLPKEWKWVGVDETNEVGEFGNYSEEGVGHYVDGTGAKIQGRVKFRVKDIESSHDSERGFLSIEGTMLAEIDEKALLEKEMSSNTRHVLGSGSRAGGSRAIGATKLGAPAEPSSDAMDIDGRPKKHRTRY